MNSGSTYTYTLRNKIKSEPRITQERVYITKFEHRLISALNLLFSAEKDKGKKANKELMKTYKTEMYKLSYNKEYFEVFTDGSKYIDFLGKWVESSEGVNNLKLKI